MTEQILLIDQGNTRLKWVLASNGGIREESADRGDFEAFAQACRSGRLGIPGRVVFSSVAGSQASQELANFCESQWSCKAQQLQSTVESHTFTEHKVQSGYCEPESLGVDRWLAILGAVAHYGSPVVVWDLGTATTIDAVDRKGQHIGGMIYPGPDTMLRALDRDTKLKVPEDLSTAGIAPGRSTGDCIRNGVFAAQVGALNQFLRNMQEQTDVSPMLVVTGGGATGIMPRLDFDFIYDPWLVFRGMLKEGVR